MCRFVSYFGHKEIQCEDLLKKPKNSLIHQSYHAKEGAHGINADGFGLGWYNFDISGEPGVFKSTQPAWSDINLRHISEKVKSSCFLAHIRASTVGDVNQNNCHPFAYKKYCMAHNGTIRNFEEYKKKIINEIDDGLFLEIRGNTDSEYLFFLIMNFIKKGSSLELAVKQSIQMILDLQKDSDAFSRINIVITNGNEILATRFVSKGKKSISLNYALNYNDSNEISSIIISSEPLSDDNIWEQVPENHYIYINKGSMKLVIEAL